MSNQVDEIHGMYNNYAEATNLHAQIFKEEKLNFSKLSDLMENIKNAINVDSFKIKKFELKKRVSVIVVLEAVSYNTLIIH